MTHLGEYVDLPDYRSLGLIANPFRTTRGREGEPIGISMEIQAAANALVSTLIDVGQTGGTRSVWVEKSPEIPSFYHLAAVALAEKRLINDAELGITHTYLQLYMLRLGRIRSALQFLAERIAFREFDVTLAAWVSEMLESPDESLDTFESAQPFLEEFTTEFFANPTDALAGVFGACEIERDFMVEDIADVRLSSQEPDIDDETDEALEADGSEGLPPATEREEASGGEAVLIEYMVDYTRAHLSPVLARAIRVYGLRGTGSIANELTITKAPRKTFKALIVFATKRFNRVVLIYDGFSNWRQVPEDIKERFVAALTELRLAMKERGSIVFIAETDEVPEIEDEQRADCGILWDFAGLMVLESEPDRLNPDLIRRWIESAALADADVDSLLEGLTPLFKEVDGSLSGFVRLAGETIDDAARRGLASIDGDAIEQARSVLSDSAPEPSDQS